MISVLPQNKFYNLYFDIFYQQSSTLLDRLTELDHFGANKIEEKCSLTSKDLNKTGYNEYGLSDNLTVIA